MPWASAILAQLPENLKTWLHSLILVCKVLVPSLPMPWAVPSQEAALDGASFIRLHQHRAGSSSSSSPWLAGKDDFGAWQAGRGECSGDLGYHKPAVKLHSLSDSFTGQHKESPKHPFLSEEFVLLELVFQTSSMSGVSMAGACCWQKPRETILSLVLLLLFIVCEETINFRWESKPNHSENPVETSFCSASGV